MFLRHNQSAVTEFFLLGFQVPHSSRIILFSVFLLVYISTVTGNLMIIILVSVTRHLHSPTYFFLCHLSFCDIMLSSTIVPFVLQVTLRNGIWLTKSHCFIQFHIFASPSGSECLLLTVMPYDRYLAICKPLHYQTIMNFTFCLGLVVLSWIMGLVVITILTILLSQLDFCKSHNINHFFCDLAPLHQASCSNTTAVKLVEVIGAPEFIIETCIIISTYVCILLAIHSISSTTGKQKAFSTCSSHLTIVYMYYGTLIAIYMFPSGEHSLNLNKIISFLYTAVAPLLNPIIYSLRNQEIKNSIKRSCIKCKQPYWECDNIFDVKL